MPSATSPRCSPADVRSASEVVERYFACMRDGDLAVVDLFVVEDERIRSLTYFVADH